MLITSFFFFFFSKSPFLADLLTSSERNFKYCLASPSQFQKGCFYILELLEILVVNIGTTNETFQQSGK